MYSLSNGVMGMYIHPRQTLRPVYTDYCMHFNSPCHSRKYVITNTFKKYLDDFVAVDIYW